MHDIQAVELLKGENDGDDMKHRLIRGGRTMMLDSCDLEEYTSTAYQKDLDRHMELIMEWIAILSRLVQSR